MKIKDLNLLRAELYAAKQENIILNQAFNLSKKALERNENLITKLENIINDKKLDLAQLK